MEASVILAVIACCISITAFATYNLRARRKENTPNIASWTIWAFLALLNFTSYGFMSDDLVKTLFPTIGSLLCIFTFVVAVVTGERRQLDGFERVALCLGVVAGLMWWQLHSATYANMAVQLGGAIGFVPTYRGIIKNPRKERSLSWWLWTNGFLVSAIVVLLRWQGQYQDLAYPVTMTIAHAGVAVLCSRKNDK